MEFSVDKLIEIVVVLVPLVLSLSIHEFAHAWSAYKLGDDTAARQGRMTLDPFAHIDLIGTIVIPVVSVLYQGFGFIGWAKPVPVSPHRFTRKVTMHQGMIITALAGPASNIVLALIAGGVAMGLYSELIDAMQIDRFWALLQLGNDSFISANEQILERMGFTKGHQAAALLIGRFFALNVGLAVFNMLPLAPLDGSRLLPMEWQMKMSRYSLLIFLGLLAFINYGGQWLIKPVLFVGNGILGLWSFIF